ncbi:MAG: hypothetical protein HS101_02550 [Planctomycetia bacterium]|nr:hypothetical protein [Planctomycetia bacterium]MCC7314364.1 hypothetical protein [Planctomycetota bacterium]
MSNRFSATLLIVTLTGGIIIGLSLRDSRALANSLGDDHGGNITCRSLTIEDARGRKRIRLTVTDKGPDVRLYDAQGRRRIQLGLRRRGSDDRREEMDMPYVSLLDAKEHPNVMLHSHQSSKGDGAGGGLTVGSTAGPGRIDLAVSTLGEATMKIEHGEGLSGVTMESRPSQVAMFSITDNEGESLFRVAGFYEDGFAGLRVQTEKGKEPWKCSK